jgi:hypothetical protein
LAEKTRGERFVRQKPSCFEEMGELSGHRDVAREAWRRVDLHPAFDVDAEAPEA